MADELEKIQTFTEYLEESKEVSVGNEDVVGVLDALGLLGLGLGPVDTS